MRPVLLLPLLEAPPLLPELLPPLFEPELPPLLEPELPPLLEPELPPLLEPELPPLLPVAPPLWLLSCVGAGAAEELWVDTSVMMKHQEQEMKRL
jgi:hypothetical protein